jgi:hypothetical protein
LNLGPQTAYGDSFHNSPQAEKIRNASQFKNILSFETTSPVTNFMEKSPIEKLIVIKLVKKFSAFYGT